MITGLNIHPSSTISSFSGGQGAAVNHSDWANTQDSSAVHHRDKQPFTRPLIRLT